MKRFPQQALSLSFAALAASISALAAKNPTPSAPPLPAPEPSTKNWDFGAQIRIRYEITDDAGSYPSRDFIRSGQVDNDNDYLLFREKIHLGWTADSWLKLYVEGRGAQAESDSRAPSPGQDVFDLHQAYAEIGDPSVFPLSLKIGRQEMTYGDQRFVGVADWNNTGRSFDAARLRWQKHKSWIDLFTSRVVIPRDEYFNESNDEDQFSGLYASSRDLWKSVESEVFFLARNTGANSPNAIAPGVGGPSERDVYTYGTRIRSLPDQFSGWDFSFEAAGQFGSVTSGGTERDLRSYAINGTVGYTFDNVWTKPRVAVGYDYASGDSDASDGKQETFEPLFGTNHSFYGIADLVGLRNLNSPRVSLSARPLEGLTVSADYLLFWLAGSADSFYPESAAARSGNGYGKDSSLDSMVGSELDVYAKYKINSLLEAQFGYAHFFVGDYIKQSIGKVTANQGASDSDFIYVQMTLTF